MTRPIAAFGVLLALVAIVAAGPARAGGGPGWKIERTPNPAGAGISVLSSVSCPRRRACIAVGSSAVTPASPTLPLAERWNGRRWRIQPIPAPKRTSDSLFAVSCPSAHACMAVGSAFHIGGHRTTLLTEIWNGRRWRVQATPRSKASASFYAVSCTSRRSCVAVGHSYASRPRAVVERWDGAVWRTQSLPRRARSAQLLGVSCPRARACTAVGLTNDNGSARPFAVSWNGRRWRVRAVPVPQRAPAAMLEAVSCTSPRRCTATGTVFGAPRPTLAERWNGRRWRAERTPNPANFRNSIGEVALDGVSCTSATACTASGDYSPAGVAEYFIESWDGTTWRLDSVPRPAGFQHGAFLGISCAPARCTAVGAYTGAVRLQVTLAAAG